jgi:hypothetical protein
MSHLKLPRTRLREIPPYDKAPILPDSAAIPYIWGPLPYLRRKRANWRMRREQRRLRHESRRGAHAAGR